MKKILITGSGSYIGQSIVKFLSQWPNEYQIDTLSTKNDGWKMSSFTDYYTVCHVAGIAHRRESRFNKELYYKINRDQAIEVARKAKQDGTKQFIFMSSMSVYGLDTGIITKDTPLIPKTHYGYSKLQAESEINTLAESNYRVCILRAPMVYGRGCKGNFQSVVKWVTKVPIFPKISNQRSLIYVDNLCNFIKILIDRELTGLYFPQNREYMSTLQMVKWISEILEKKEIISPFLGLITNLMQPYNKVIRKAFGTLIYKDLEVFNFDYCLVDLEESVKRSI